MLAGPRNKKYTCRDCGLQYKIGKAGPQTSQDCVVIRDIGPWDLYPTITNGAEYVVEGLAETLRGRRLEYYDSEGQRDQILVKEGRLAGFAPAGEQR